MMSLTSAILSAFFSTGVLTLLLFGEPPSPLSLSFVAACLCTWTFHLALYVVSLSSVRPLSSVSTASVSTTVLSSSRVEDEPLGTLVAVPEPDPLPLLVKSQPLEAAPCLDHNVSQPDSASFPASPSSSEFHTRREEYLSTKPWPGIVTDFDRERQLKAIPKLAEMRSVMAAWLEQQRQVSGDFPSEFDDITLCRFLRARDSNVKAASEMLIAHLEWRLAHGILASKPKCELCTADHLQHAYFCLGKDCYNRAVMYSCSARARHIGAKEGIWHIVCEVEASIDDANAVSQIVWVVDFKGFQARHSNPDLGRLAASLFQANYPERLGQIVLLDFPFIFSVFLSIIKPLLDPVTRSKIVVLTSPDAQGKYYRENWPPRMASFMTETRKLPAAPGSYPPEFGHEFSSRYRKKLE